MSLTRITKALVFIRYTLSHGIRTHCRIGKQVQRMRHGYYMGRT